MNIRIVHYKNSFWHLVQPVPVEKYFVFRYTGGTMALNVKGALASCQPWRGKDRGEHEARGNPWRGKDRGEHEARGNPWRDKDRGEHEARGSP